MGWRVMTEAIGVWAVTESGDDIQVCRGIPLRDRILVGASQATR